MEKRQEEQRLADIEAEKQRKEREIEMAKEKELRRIKEEN
jgi:hypothetical protein